jgi:hypothetical protein
MTRARTVAACDASVAAEIDAYMKRPCWPAPADGLTGLQHVQSLRTPEFIAQADADWNAIPTDLDALKAWMKGGDA